MYKPFWTGLWFCECLVLFEFTKGGSLCWTSHWGYYINLIHGYWGVLLRTLFSLGHCSSYIHNWTWPLNLCVPAHHTNNITWLTCFSKGPIVSSCMCLCNDICIQCNTPSHYRCLIVFVFCQPKASQVIKKIECKEKQITWWQLKCKMDFIIVNFLFH